MARLGQHVSRTAPSEPKIVEKKAQAVIRGRGMVKNVCSCPIFQTDAFDESQPYSSSKRAASPSH